MINYKKEIDRNNSLLILIYLALLTITVIGYLFMVAFADETYNSQIYKNGYVYFIGFQFLLFSIVFPYWSIEKEDTLLNLFISIVIFSSASIPIILMIIILGNLNNINFIIPIIVQILWGGAILSIKSLLNTTKLKDSWKCFLVQMIIFIVIIGSLVAFYFYYKYGNLVITTVYDKDIPKVFFLNPIATAIGNAYSEVGGGTQLGNLPIMYMSIFNIAIIVINYILVKKRKTLV